MTTEVTPEHGSYEIINCTDMFTELEQLRAECSRLKAELDEALGLMYPGGEAYHGEEALFDSFANSDMADRMRFLAKHGWLTLIEDRGRCVTAKPGPKMEEKP